MTISRFTSTSAYRGGLHGEAPASHDEKKDQQEGLELSEAVAQDRVNEGQENDRTQGEIGFEDRQSHQGSKEIDEVNPEEEGFTMTAEDLTPKAKVASALGSMFNDPRITNVLMLVLVLIGMGGAEAVQSQVCSL